MLHEQYAANHISRREPSLDFVRGIAVLLMIAAHAIYFFHNDTSPVLQIVARIANTAAFTVFLFVSGAAAFYSVTAEDRASRAHSLRILFHSVVLLVGYYTVAFTVILTRQRPETLPEILGRIASAALFLQVPSFSEFLIPFVLLSLSVLPLAIAYRFFAKRPYWAATGTLFLYVLGVALYPLILPSPWRELKALFAGDEGLLRFPVLHYFGIFAAGLGWGRYLSEHDAWSSRVRRSFLLLLGSFTVFVLSAITFSATRLAFLDPLSRWPPSVGFLAAGLTGVFFFSLVGFNLPHARFAARMNRFVHYLGADSFDLFVIHIVLLHLYQRFLDWRFAAPVPVFFMYVVLLLLSAVISSFNWKISPSLFTLGPISFSGLSRHRIRKRYLVFVIVLAAVTVFRINAAPATTTIGGVVPREGIAGQETSLPPCGEDADAVWFDADYGYCRSVTVANGHPSKAMLKGDVVGLEVDFSDLVNIGKVLPSGDDLLVVSEVPSIPKPVFQTFVPSAQTTAMIFFTLEEDIPPGSSDNRYVLYYGSDVPIARPVLSDRVISDLPYRTRLGAEGIPELSLTRNRRWFLIGDSESPPPLTVTLSVRGENAGREFSFEIPET